MKWPVRSASKGLCGALVKSRNDGGNGMFQRPLWWLTGTIWLVACSGGTEPGIRPCTGGIPVNLAVTQYVSLDAGVDSGCVEFPATSSIVEYLVVPQLATGTPGQMTSFVLGGDTKLVIWPGVPVASWGTTRYSTIELVAGNSTHPESTPASSDTYWVTARFTGMPPVHGRMPGSVPPLHATNQIVPVNHQSGLWNIPFPPSFRDFTSAPQSPLEADRTGDFMESDHCHEQRFQRDIPLRKRTA